ncbi:MAG: DUF2262 domain-containing protein [Clostridiales bacterium]|nr:DUF2262 domain-containing protein [Clostridiales bacterium]
MDILVLSNDYKADYNEDLKGYQVEVDYNGGKVMMTLVPYKNNDDSLEALKYSFNKLISELEEYDEDAMGDICDKLGPYLEKAIPEAPDLTPEELVSDFILKKVAVMDTNRVGMSESEGLKIVFSYGKAGIDDPRMELMAIGYLDSGFDTFYINGQQMATMPLTMSYDLSCGAKATYNLNTEIFDAKVNLFGREVVCFLELDDNELGAKNSIALFEKLYAHIDDYDKKARRFITENLHLKIDRVRDNLDIPDLSVENVMEDIFLDSIVCGAEEDIDMTYCFRGEENEMRAAVTGTLDGFKSFLLEFGEAGEFDEY